MEIDYNKRHVLFIKNTELAKEPTKAHKSDAGFDLYSIVNKIIQPGKVVEIDTGIQIAQPDEVFGIIYTRSSYGMRGLQVHNGIIDNGYRGKISVFIYNHSRSPFYVKREDKVAQIIFFNGIVNLDMLEVDCLPGSDRGKKGFGSSGR